MCKKAQHHFLNCLPNCVCWDGQEAIPTTGGLISTYTGQRLVHQGTVYTKWARCILQVEIKEKSNPCSTQPTYSLSGITAITSLLVVTLHLFWV